MQHFSKKKKDDMEQVASIEELLTEILVRLPARPLVRFKCVSKHWLSLISDPKFCRRHTLQNFRPSVSAVFPYPSRSTTALSFIPLGALGHNPRRSNHANHTLPCSTNSCHPFNFVPNLHEIMIFQSCNGLFLCCPRVTTIPPRYYVLNPTTNQFSTIIYPGHVSTYISHQALAFDPSRSPHYKLLLFRGVSFWDSDLFIDIYSSETKSWRIAESSFSNLDCHPKYNGVVYCNGAVHWVGDPKQISYYHINDERVGHVFELDRRTHESKYGFLQESHCGGSHLHLIDIYSSHIQVLELERDYSGFRLKYHIELDRIFTTLLWPRKMKFSVLYLSREKIEGDESSYLLLHNPGQIFWYNLKSNISKSFQLTPRRASKEELRVGLPNIKGVLNFQYMETLAGV